MPNHSRNPSDLHLRRRLRQAETPAEATLWNALRGRQLAGAKFRRQAHICGWVVDFACMAARLVVEVDGGVHDTDEQRRRDTARDAWLAHNGWRVLRIRNEELVDLQAVLGRVAGALRELPSPPALRADPSPAEAGEG